ncbi:MAG: hypothetical protein NZ749_06830 [bacterium]|nr:hypothetical protein [bacterium]
MLYVRGMISTRQRFSEREARRWLRGASVNIELFAEEPMKIYTSARAGQALSLETLRQELGQVLHYADTHLPALTRAPDAVYLLDPPLKRRLLPCAQGFPWGVFVDASSITYSPDPTRFHLAVRRAFADAMLSDALHDSPFAAGLVEVLARAGDDTLVAEVVGLSDNGLVRPQMSLWDHALAAGSFVQFLTERFGWDLWRQVDELLPKRTKGIRGVAVLEPEASWLLGEVCGTPNTRLQVDWWGWIRQRGDEIDVRTRLQQASRQFIREAYSAGLLTACQGECERYLAEYGRESEITFYLAACDAHLRRYADAVERLSGTADDMVPLQRAWAYLRLGQSYDLMEAREIALRWYEKIGEVSDPWGIILSYAESFVQQPYLPFDERVQGDPWLHFSHWLSRGGEATRASLGISGRRSSSVLVVGYSMS